MSSQHGISWNSRLLSHIYAKLSSDKRFFERSKPKRFPTLAEMLESAVPTVELESGENLELDLSDLSRLARDLPWYLHGFVRLPWTFVYSRTGLRGVFRLITPSRWSARALNYLLKGDIAGEAWEVGYAEMKKLMSKYKTLILVVLEIHV
ncbi:MAG: DUF61 family protein [Thermoproteota archaeon]